MTTGMRIFLIAGSVLSCVYVLSKIRKSKMRMENSIFWIFFSVILVVLGIFPGIAEWFAGLLGVQSTVNLVYLVIIFLLVLKGLPAGPEGCKDGSPAGIPYTDIRD